MYSQPHSSWYREPASQGAVRGPHPVPQQGLWAVSRTVLRKGGKGGNHSDILCVWGDFLNLTSQVSGGVGMGEKFASHAGGPTKAVTC